MRYEMFLAIAKQNEIKLNQNWLKVSSKELHALPLKQNLIGPTDALGQPYIMSFVGVEVYEERRERKENSWCVTATYMRIRSYKQDF